MKVVCQNCQKDMGEKVPLDNKETILSFCAECTKKLYLSGEKHIVKMMKAIEVSEERRRRIAQHMKGDRP